MHAQLHQTFCDPVDYSPAGSSVHGISLSRILECVTISFPRGSSNPGIEPLSFVSPTLTGEFFTTGATWEFLYILATNPKFS